MGGKLENHAGCKSISGGLTLPSSTPSPIRAVLCRQT